MSMHDDDGRPHVKLVDGKVVLPTIKIKFPQHIRFVSHRLRPAPVEQFNDYVGEVRTITSLEKNK